MLLVGSVMIRWIIVSMSARYIYILMSYCNGLGVGNLASTVQVGNGGSGSAKALGASSYNSLQASSPYSADRKCHISTL